MNIFTKENAMIPKRCWRCGSNDINVNWKLQFYHCRKCQNGGTIPYAVDPKGWKKWKLKHQ